MQGSTAWRDWQSNPVEYPSDITLLKLNAVVRVKGTIVTADGKDTLTRLVSQRSMPFQKIPQTPGGSRQSPVIW
jgi:hypothetical protein